MYPSLWQLLWSAISKLNGADIILIYSNWQYTFSLIKFTIDSLLSRTFLILNLFTLICTTAPQSLVSWPSPWLVQVLPVEPPSPPLELRVDNASSSILLPCNVGLTGRVLWRSALLGSARPSRLFFQLVVGSSSFGWFLPLVVVSSPFLLFLLTILSPPPV